MTNREAVKTLILGMYKDKEGYIRVDRNIADDFLYAIGMAISVLMKQEEENRKPVWHDAKADPPKTHGIYYGKKNGNNSMWLCHFSNGNWVNESYQDQTMDIDMWAEYTDFKSVD